MAVLRLKSKAALMRAAGRAKRDASKARRVKKPEPPIFGRDAATVFPFDPDCLLKVRLPIRLTNNNHGRSGTYHKSAKFRRECELQLRAWGLDRLVLGATGGSFGPPPELPFPFPVDVTVIRVLGPHQRKWDSSSILRGNWKEIEDALVAIGWFHDDSPDWIRRTIPDQCSTDRGNGPSIIIEIRRTL